MIKNVVRQVNDSKARDAVHVSGSGPDVIQLVPTAMRYPIAMRCPYGSLHECIYNCCVSFGRQYFKKISVHGCALVVNYMRS